MSTKHFVMNFNPKKNPNTQLLGESSTKSRRKQCLRAFSTNVSVVTDRANDDDTSTADNCVELSF